MAFRKLTLDYIADPDRAARLLHPLRLSILNLAEEPISATEIASRLGLSRQRVNYHVRELARAGFLRRAGRRRRRNMIEQLYVTSAQGFLLSPELLGRVGADWRRIPDASSAEYLIALCSQMQSDVLRADRAAAQENRRITTQTIKSQFRFETAAQREAFVRVLQETIVEVIARRTSPNARPDGSPAPGLPYRLVLGFYPYVPVQEAPKQARATGSRR